MLVIITSFSCVCASNKYEVAEASSKKINVLDNFETIKEAEDYYNEHLEEYDNLLILEDDKVIKMEYGVVEFISDSCRLNNDYSSIYNGSNYLNSCYSSEAAYIDTDNNYKNVSFMLSGDIGKISIDEIKLIPYEALDKSLSTYIVKDNYLIHNIKTSLEDNYYAYSNKLDFKLDYLKDNKEYFSYDGHYFYDDFKVMIDDYRSGNFVNAINMENAYYNYYMYLPHRSYTNYNKSDIQKYFDDVLHIDGKIQYYDDLNYDNANDDVNLSQLYNELDSFFGYENLYGANAMLMLSLSSHESAYGKSYLAFTKNNLFGHAAYDSDPERNASRYENVEGSIYSHAKYFISRLYGNIYSKVYYGSFIGDKKSGMNVLYSSDPYWSEKIASLYFTYDEALGLKDYNSYSLGIVRNKDVIRVYKDSNLSSSSFSIYNIKNYSFIILEELDDVYKVQVDPSFSNEYLYDPENSIGYIDKDIIDIHLNQDTIKEKDYIETSFNLDNGEIISKDELTIKTPIGKEVTLPKPYKKGFEFVDFDDDNNALYKEIKNIEVSHAFSNVMEAGTTYNLKGGKLLVHYTDDTKSEIDIDSNMISSFDINDIELDHLVINYNGVKVDYPYSISSELKETHEKIAELISKNIESYKENGDYNKDELMFIKNNIKTVDYRTSFDDIRYIDKMLLEETRENVNYNIKDSEYNVSLSGLALSLDEIKPLSIFKPFKDTYYIETTKLDKDTENIILSVASPYGFEKEEGVRVRVKLNLEVANFTNPIIIQVKLPHSSNNKIYTVYHLDENGNVIKCNTTWSNNYVTFMARSEGDFLVLSKEGINTYDLEDKLENVSIENADPDNHLLFIEGSIFITIALFGFIMIIIHAILSKKEEEIWNDYKKSLQVAESPQEEKPKN